MINEIYKDNVRIISRESRNLGNCRGWVYTLEDGRELITKEVGKCIIHCSECENRSKPITFKTKYATKKWHCQSCCRKGERNPFYGKSHDREMIEATKEKLREISKDKWKDPDYRKKVIKGVSKPRREGFKAEQSARVTQWYQNHPEQRELRSKRMQKTWEDGKIEPNQNCICNRSKAEKDLFNFVTESFPTNKVNTDVIRIGSKWVYPDICVDNKVIIEYYGNYWHGNPAMYSESDKVAYNSTAGEIWKKDKNRIDMLHEAGYSVIIIWEKEYLNSKEETCLKLLEKIQRQLLQ